MSHPGKESRDMKRTILLGLLWAVGWSKEPVRAEEELDLLGQPRKPQWLSDFEARKARQAREMEDFVGAVYRGEGNFVMVDEDTAVGSGGAIVRAGDSFLTPRGAYVKVGDCYLRPDGGAVVEVGDSFVSWDGAMVRAGDAYVGSMGTSMVAGGAILRNFRPKPGWRSR
jgi:hypothetical protein